MLYIDNSENVLFELNSYNALVLITISDFIKHSGLFS